MAREHPEVLKAFGTSFRESQAGRTGIASADFTLDYHKLLKAAGASNAETCILAEEHLRRAASYSQGLLVLETHPRDDKLILLVRLKRDGGEEWLFNLLGEESPTQERVALAMLFESFRGSNLPEHWLTNLSHLARTGGSIDPFRRSDLPGNRELLTVLSRVLEWKGESLLRFASCVFCRDSKRLEKIQGRLEAALRQITGQTLEDLGLLGKPRQVLLHGPLRLDGLDFASLRGAVTISETDIQQAESVACSAIRILTVENETSFLELVKLNRGETLLIQTSHPNRALVSLLSRLSADLPSFHFGDTDPAGFDILRSLREKTGRLFQPLHMRFRPCDDAPALTTDEIKILARLLADASLADCHAEIHAMCEAGSKGDFEQESLGRPTVNGWPFYPASQF